MGLLATSSLFLAYNPPSENVERSTFEARTRKDQAQHVFRSDLSLRKDRPKKSTHAKSVSSDALDEMSGRQSLKFASPQKHVSCFGNAAKNSRNAATKKPILNGFGG
jgi:hypothetical protein